MGATASIGLDPDAGSEALARQVAPARRSPGHAGRDEQNVHGSGRLNEAERQAAA